MALWRLPEERGAAQSRWLLLDEVAAHRGHRHDDSLLTLVDAALTRQALRVEDIALVGVGVGPGSFTGVRVGMATALGLGLATGAPVWPVDSLAALAMHAAGVAAVAPDGERQPVIMSMFDARKGEVYAAAYRAVAGAAPEIVLAPMVAPCHRCLTALDATVGDNAPRLIFGSGALQYDVASAVPPEWHVASARHIGALAAFAWEAAGRDGAAAPAADPRYLRKSDAEIAHDAG